MKNFLRKFRRKGQQAENDKTERVTGLGRRTREETAKWNQRRGDIYTQNCMRVEGHPT